MKKIILSLGIMAFSLISFSQQTLLSDDFESGNSNWTLNPNLSGDNSWVINNHYLAGTLSQFGVPNTPPQPAGITPSNGSYLHITSQTVCNLLPMLGGTTNHCNANFESSSQSDNSAVLAQAINATNMTNVSISFWYICAGDATAYGTVEYSLNNGNTWVQMGAILNNQSTWTQLTLTDAALNNQSSILFKFRWINTAGSTGSDPSFSVDNVSITANGGSVGNTSITTSLVSPSSWCFTNNDGVGQNLTVNFTSTGTFSNGNIYTAELSDASGSFSNPVNIGTLTSSSNGALAINAIVPPGTPAGNGYRIRVVSSNPNTIGTDNNSNLIIHALPIITITSNPANGIINSNQSATLTASGANSYVWSPASVVNNSTTPTVVVTPTQTVEMTVIGTDANGCKNTATFTVTVNPLSLDNIESNNFSIFPNPTKNTFTIESTDNEIIKSVNVYDLNGKLVKSFETTNSYNVESLNSGIYTVKISTEKSYSTMKLVVE